MKFCKRALALFLAVVCVSGCGGNMNIPLEEPKAEFEEYISYREPLYHTFQRLHKDKELKIVYYGGSVTLGSGSTDREEYSWRALSGAWFKEQYPDAEITTINMALGSCGTLIGTYRVQEDVIAQEPDLVFLEYAINDNYRESDMEKAAMQYETIVREIRQALPKCDIVGLLVTDQTVCRQLPDMFPMAEAHAKVAEHYGISMLNVGHALAESMQNPKDENEWNQYFSDYVHPSDLGYQKYYECVEEYLWNSLKCTDFTGISAKKKLPTMYSESLLDGDRVSVFGEELEEVIVASEGFKYYDRMFAGPFHTGYYEAKASEENAFMEFAFEGTEFAFWTSFQNTSRIEYSVDGEEPVEIACHIDPLTQVVTGLEPGEHTIRIWPSVYGTGSEKRMRIGAIFSRDASQETTK